MEKGKGIVSFSTEELMAKHGQGESKTDLSRVRAKTEEDLQKDIGLDTEWKSVSKDWHQAAEAIMPVSKKLISLRIDVEVIDWFKDKGPGYQTRINAVLKSFIKQNPES